MGGLICPVSRADPDSILILFPDLVAGSICEGEFDVKRACFRRPSWYAASCLLEERLEISDLGG